MAIRRVRQYSAADAVPAEAAAHKALVEKRDALIDALYRKARYVPLPWLRYCHACDPVTVLMLLPHCSWHAVSDFFCAGWVSRALCVNVLGGESAAAASAGSGSGSADGSAKDEGRAGGVSESKAGDGDAFAATVAELKRWVDTATPAYVHCGLYFRGGLWSIFVWPLM